MNAIINEAPEPILQIDPQYSKVLMRALSKDRTDRYSTCRTLILCISNKDVYCEPSQSRNDFATLEEGKEGVKEIFLSRKHFEMPANHVKAPHNVDTFVACPSCAENIKASTKKCRFCGFILAEDLHEAVQKQSIALSHITDSVRNEACRTKSGRLYDSGIHRGKSKVTAAILAFIFGGFGAHKFYLGCWGWGCIYIASCVTLVPTLVSMVEALGFLIMSQQDFDNAWNFREPGPFSW